MKEATSFSFWPRVSFSAGLGADGLGAGAGEPVDDVPGVFFGVSAAFSLALVLLLIRLDFLGPASDFEELLGERSRFDLFSGFVSSSCLSAWSFMSCASE